MTCSSLTPMSDSVNNPWEVELVLDKMNLALSLIYLSDSLSDGDRYSFVAPNM